jgi:hypothetical protein
LGVAVFDTDFIQNGHQILTDQIVAAVLHEDTQGGGHKRTVPHALRLEKFCPTASAGFVFDLKRFSDLGKFDVRKFSRCVVFSMILDQNGESFLASIFTN